MSDLQTTTQEILGRLEQANQARELALSNSRHALRASANAIRALHRGDFGGADQLLAKASELLVQADSATQDHPQIRWAGFVHDAQKEYAEGRITQAVLADGVIPTPADLSISGEAWLHGVAESIGELRRKSLDTLRGGDVERADQLVTIMEEMYEVLLLVDYPDAMTHGLRRAADASRQILERTRADVSLAAVQLKLEQALEASLPV